MPVSVLVAGALANKLGHGGEAWVRLSWVLGLERLGCDVALVEQVSHPTPAQRDYFDSTVDLFGLGGRAWLVEEGAEAPEELLDRADGADLLVNISGHLTLEAVLARVTRKAYIDLDPGYTQLWQAAGLDGARLQGHDVFFTVGANIGRPGCDLPTGGIEWLGVRPPVLLSAWPVESTESEERLTTVASWRGAYGRVEHDGKRYGLKLDEFRKVIALPARVPQRLELALDIHGDEEDDLEQLRRHGWRLVDPREAAGTPDAFRSYIQQSGGEFSVAQGIYVETSCGWFSDRTACYLASGKPTLVQDTGFGTTLPTDEGLVSFRTVDEAAAGAESISADYERHCRAARALAEQEFDSDVVLGRFLQDALL
jgi:hypothetical protein